MSAVQFISNTLWRIRIGSVRLFYFSLSNVITSYLKTDYISYTHTHITHYIYADTTVVTIIILTFCCILNIIGITESAKVSLGIFAFHLITMITLVVCSIVTAMTSIPHVGERTVLDDNWNDSSLPHSLPLVRVLFPFLFFYFVFHIIITKQSLFYGLGAGLLGVSGFESSANFRESQADGVFPKTLRNMWAIVATLNPTLGMLAICLLPLSTISEEASSGALLSTMAGITSKYLKIWVGIDAFFVLTGAVLSAFVGFGGLCVRMSFDGDLPRFLQLQTSWNTNYCIILSYFVLTITMVFVCDGDISDLSGVYTIAFLSVMSCFAIGNMLLKYFPSTGLPKAPPEQQASWIGVSFGLCGVLLGLVSNIMSRSVTALVAFVGFSMFFSLVIVVTRIFQKPHKRRSSNIESSMKNALLSDFATITEENFVRAYV